MSATLDTEKQTAATSTGELSEAAYEVLRAAVNIARNEQVRTAASLRIRLAKVFPEQTPEVIQQALTFWANRIAATGSHLRA